MSFPFESPLSLHPNPQTCQIQGFTCVLGIVQVSAWGAKAEAGGAHLEKNLWGLGCRDNGDSNGKDT